MNEMIKEDNTKKLIIIICGFLLILIAIFLIVIGVINSQKEELLINKLESASLKTGCSTIKVEEMKNIVEYSFDNGKTWQKSNYNIICDNGNIKILGRDKNKKILAEGSIKIDDLYENYPKIKIDFDKIINTFDDNTLLKGITAHSNNQDVTEKIIIESKEYKDNKLIVTYSVTDENGNKTTIEREIETEKLNFEIISFEKTSYTCSVGEQIETVITAESSTNLGVGISGFESANTNIATIEKNPRIAIKSPNKKAVIIDCKKAGETTLSAKSTTGAKTEVKVTVKPIEIVSQEKISFEKTNYTCTLGEQIETTITAESSTNPEVGISWFESANTNIATIEKNPRIAINSPNKKAVLISCKKVGETTLSAKSTTGAKTEVKVTVKPIEIVSQEKIYFEKTSYTCTVGKQIETVITAESSTNLGVGISGFESANTNIATIEKNPRIAIKSPNKKAVIIDCKKAGETTLSAKSTTGAKTEVKVTVKPIEIVSQEKISFQKTSYTCTLGEEIETTITAESSTNPEVGISWFESANTNIATIEKNPRIAINSPNKKAVLISCKKAGETTLSAKSTTGAKTEVKITVKPIEIVSQEKISFEKTSYTCSVGEQIETVITAESSTNLGVGISGFESANTNIATIEKNPRIAIKSPNKKAVIIDCKKAGETTLSAKSTTGAKTEVKITVK